MSLLAQTGAIGTALFVAFAAAAAVAGIRRRREGTAEASIAAGGVTAFAYWLLHGSVDWLWEFPALGLSAFSPARAGDRPLSRPAVSADRRLRLVTVAVCAVVAASFVAPWIAARQVARAGDVWRQDPTGAYATLDQAAELNPLSDAALVLAGTIAAERGDVGKMRRSFERAVSRDPHNWFSRTQLAVASGERRRLAGAPRARCRSPPRSIRESRSCSRCSVRSTGESRFDPTPSTERSTRNCRRCRGSDCDAVPVKVRDEPTGKAC